MYWWGIYGQNWSRTQSWVFGRIMKPSTSQGKSRSTSCILFYFLQELVKPNKASSALNEREERENMLVCKCAISFNIFGDNSLTLTWRTQGNCSGRRMDTGRMSAAEMIQALREENCNTTWEVLGMGILTSSLLEITVFIKKKSQRTINFIIC